MLSKRRLFEQRLGFPERGFVAHRLEQFRRLGEQVFGSWLAGGEQAAAVAEEGVDVFGNLPNCVPSS